MGSQGSDEESPHNEAGSEQPDEQALPLSFIEKQNLKTAKSLVEQALKEENRIWSFEGKNFVSHKDLLNLKQKENIDMDLTQTLSYLVTIGELESMKTPVGNSYYTISVAQDSSAEGESGQFVY